MRSTTSALIVALATAAPAFAQTFSNCDPTKSGDCPADKALSAAVKYDFSQGPSSDFLVSTGSAPTYDKSGATFAIASKGDAPTITSNWYMMFGHYDIVMKPAPGAGIVSSIVLQSDDLDEVDFEWIGSYPDQVQTNYYGRGNTAAYDRGMNISTPAYQSSYHTYSIDWTADLLTWSIDGKVVRSLTPQTADQTPFNQYPQSPMQLKIGNWDGGDSSSAGTANWAGGAVDWSKGPFDMLVQSVTAIDYSTGSSYSYDSGSDGTWKSIKSSGGTINSSGNPNKAVVTASVNTAVSSTAMSMAGGVVAGSAASTGSAPNSTVTNSVSITPLPSNSASSCTSNAPLSPCIYICCISRSPSSSSSSSSSPP